MKLKNYFCVLLAIIGIAGSLAMPAEAAATSDENAIFLEDMEWIWIDSTEVDLWEPRPMPLTANSVDASISAQSINTVGNPIYLTANDMVTFDCSYSPASASMDFGVIAPNGRFYYINVKEGSINQAIRISQSGSYSLAIRNNSSQTVRVVGFVNY